MAYFIENKLGKSRERSSEKDICSSCNINMIHENRLIYNINILLMQQISQPISEPMLSNFILVQPFELANTNIISFQLSITMLSFLLAIIINKKVDIQNKISMAQGSDQCRCIELQTYPGLIIQMGLSNVRASTEQTNPLDH